MKQGYFYSLLPNDRSFLAVRSGQPGVNNRFFVRLILAVVALLAGMPAVSFAQLPAITSVSQSVGYPLSVVTITGSNFNATAANNIVYFGATKATVSVTSATSLTVTVPVGATFAPVSVDNTASALTGYSQYPFLPSFGGPDVINFSAPVDFTAGTHSQRVVIGDVDGDGKPDIVVLDYSNDIITVFRNTSVAGSITAGSFAAGVTFPTGDYPYSLAIGDLDGDGKPDIVVSNSIDGNVSVFLNTSTPGAVSMAPKVDFPIISGAYPVDVAIGDIDGDGKADIAVIDLGGFNVYVLRNTSSIGVINSGSFAAAVGFPTGTVPEGLAIGDIDGDGLKDIVLANRDDNTFSVFLNRSTPGSISMAAEVPVSTGGTSDNPIGVALADFDGDGMLDVAILDNGSEQIGVFHNASSVGSVSFSGPTNFATGVHPSFSIGIGDFNGDGMPDMVAANLPYGTVSIYQNTTTTIGVINSGSFATQNVFSLDAGSAPNWVAVGDLDGDGKPDIAIANESGGMSILQNLANTPPTFINGNAQVLTVLENASTVNISGLLHVSDIDAAQTETWTQATGPVNGTLTITAATAVSGSTNITPGGSITYAPAHGYAGADSFTVQVSDGITTATATIYVTVVPDPVVSLSGNASCATSTLTATTNIMPYQVVWNNGTANYQTTGPSWSSTNTTVAANGIPSFGLGYIALDASGNIYAVVNNTVVKYPAGSNSSTPGVVVAANGLNNAVAVRLDAAGDIFVADNNEGSGDIAEFPPTSDASTPATIVAQNGLQDPVDVFVDAAGNIYAADVNGYVMKFPPNSNSSTPGTIVAQAGLQHPVGVFVDGSGNIYVSDNFIPAIVEFPPTSSSATTGNTVGAVGLGSPNGIYVDGLGNVYVADRAVNDIEEYPSGSDAGTNPVIIVSNAQLQNSGTPAVPIDVVLDANGNLFLAEFIFNQVVEFPNNISLTSLAATGGNYTAAVTTFASGTATTNTVTVLGSCNTPPTFVNGNAQVLTVLENASATNISGLLHVSDIDAAQTETWTQYAGPVNGALTFTAAMAASGSTNITPGGSITYTPAHGYSGADSFTLQVSDGIATATTTVYVTVVPDPLVSLSGSTCTGSTLTVASNITPYQVVWNNGTTNYLTAGPSWSNTGTTVAANGIPSFGLGYIALDASGNIYAVVNNTVVKYPAGSNSSTPGVVVAANGLNNAVAVRLDAAGDIFVADNNEGSGDIAEFPPTSDASTPATIVAQNGLQDPVDVFVDAAGNIYAADVNGYVMKFPPNSNSSTPGTIVAQAGLQHPVGVFVDGSGNIYVSDNFIPAIVEFPPTSSSATTGNTVGAVGLGSPNGIYVDGLGNVYVADRAVNDIEEYPSGSDAGTNPVIIVSNAQLQNSGTPAVPIDVVLDANGNLFIAEFVFNQVAEFTNNISLASVAATTGNYTAAVTTFAGGMATTNALAISLGPNVTAVPNQAICNGTTSTVNFSGSSVSGTTYTWTNSNSGIGLATTGTGNISFAATNVTDVADSGIIIVTPMAGTCPGAPDTFNIRVNPTPDVSPMPGQAVCNNAATTATDFSGIISSATYAWTNNNSGIGLAASGTGDSIASFTATNATVAAISATVTVTPSSAGCTGAQQSFKITVSPTPTVAAITDQTLCNNATTASVNFSGTIAGTTFAWGNNAPGIGLAATGRGSIPSFTVTNTTNTTVSATITISPSANGCIGSPGGFSINVNPTPTVAAIPDQSLCNSTATAIVNFVGTVAGSNYTWTNTNTGIGLIATDTGNILPFIATNSTGSAITGTITVTPSANSCTGTPQDFSITVNPTPTVAAITDQTLCNNATTASVNFSGTIAGTTFAWGNNAPGIGLAATGRGSIPSFTVTNTTNTTVSATITISPSANGCIGSPGGFSINVNPTPTVAAIPDQSLCNSTATAIVNFVGTVAGSNYTWTNTNTGIGLIATDTGNILPFIATNSTGSAITGTITVTPSANSCTGTPQDFSITVNPTPTVAAITNQAVCDNAATATVNFSGIVSGATYTWTNNNTAIGLLASGSSDITSFMATNGTGAAVTGTITVTPSTAFCTGAPEDFSITVDPVPTMSGTLVSSAMCSGNVFIYIPGSTIAGTTYAWSSPVIAGISVSSLSGVDSVQEAIVNSTTAPIVDTFAYTLTANSCTNTQNVVVTVNPSPQLSSILTPSAVCDGMVFSYAPSSLTGDSSFTWVRLPVPGTGISGSSGSGAIHDTLTNTTAFNVADTYKYMITAYGCTDSDLVQVTVHPTPVLSSTTGPQAICSGATFSYTPASITPSTIFAWSRAAVMGISPVTGTGTNDINETLTNSSVAPLQVAYLYTLTAYGCPGHNENVNLIVNPNPGAGMITTAVANVCDNTFAQNFGAATPPLAYESYTWSATDATVQNVGSTQQYCLVDFTTIGDATVILTATVDSTGCSAQSSYPVTISSGVSMQPYVTYSYGEFVCLENVGNAVTSYQWGYDNEATLDSTILIGQINQSYVISNPDTVHNYYWVMMEQNGCLKKSYYGGPPTTVTTVNAGMTDVKVYPNPTSDNINVEINSTYAGNVTVELSDMLGQKINEVPAMDNRAVFNVSGLASGIYVIACYRDGIKISTTKFIKE